MRASRDGRAAGAFLPGVGAGRPGSGTSGARLLGVFLAAEAALVGTSVLLAVLLARSGWSPLEAGQAAWPLPVLLAVPALIAVVAAVGGVALFGAGPRPGRVRRELAGARRTGTGRGRDLLVGVGFGVGGLLLVVPAAAAWTAWSGGGSGVGDVLGGLDPGLGAGIAIFVVVWLVAPLAEEVLFRGVLWRALERWGWNRWAVFGVTTLGFALAHLEWQRTPLLLVVSIPMGLARLVTGNLTAAVAAHQFNNFLPALATLLSGLGVLG